jgi:hypothetical protein
MSKPTRPILPPEIEIELRGLPYTWTLGAKHWHLRLDGDLVAVWSRGRPSNVGKPGTSIRAAIRRWKKNRGLAA